VFAEQMRAAIDGARTLARLDELSRSIWQAHGRLLATTTPGACRASARPEGGGAG
jgi:hypothetical protein